VFLLNFLFSVFCHCTTSWRGEMLSLSLFSELVCMVVLVPGLSSRVLGVISPSQDQIFISLCSWSIFLDSALLYCCYLAIIALLMMFLQMHQSVPWEQVLPHFLFRLSWSLVICWLPTIASNILYVMASYHFWLVPPLPQYILRSQCVWDSMGTSRKLKNPV
jgi:hypothetical protein